MKTIDEIRMDFEAWAVRQVGDTMELKGTWFGNSWMYLDRHVNATWTGWLSCERSQEETVRPA